MSDPSLGVDSRMRAMMRRRRVDILELHYDDVGATLERARERCGQCANVGACLDWLEAKSSPGAPDFCANDQLFRRFRVT
jgi:uncharacterized protein DUF6455